METKVLTNGSGARDSFVVFRNSQGSEARGTLLRLTRYLVVFEVYNPYSILQLSEVLNEVHIFMADRLVYSGRAVVSSLVNTGIMLICQADLDEAWIEVDLFSPLNQPGRLRGEFAEFIKEWNRVHQILPEYKVAVADLQTYLADLRRWFEQVELGIRSSPTGERAPMELALIEDLRGDVLPSIDRLFQRFEGVAHQIDGDLQPLHRTYVKRQLHPLILCAPFAYRTYLKPLGYAGDYEMVNMILRDPHEGGSLFAKVLNVWLLSQPSAEAHRNRVKYLVERLDQEVRRVVAGGRPARILNLGCGPAGEIQSFLRKSEVADQADFLLLDFNDETLQYAKRVLESLKERQHRTTGLSFEKRSVHQILKDSSRRVELPMEARYDLIYCAGLFDYLSDRVCKRLMDHFYEHLAPGGLLVGTNVDSSNPNRNSMDFILEWHLTYRDHSEMGRLAPCSAPSEQCVVRADSTRVNIFLEVRRPYAR